MESYEIKQKQLLIILCSYNGEKYISEQIDSILSQDYENFILRVVDDCSKDKTVEIILQYISKYPNRIELKQRNEPTGSACINFLMAMNEAISDDYQYYMLSDQDDVWFANKVSTMIEEIHKCEKKFGREMPILVHSDAVMTDEQINVTYRSMLKYVNRKGDNISFGELLMDNRVTGAASIFNKALINKLKTIPKHAFMHDHWLALCATAFGKVEYINRPLYYYRRHSNTATDYERIGIVRQFVNRMGFGSKTYKEMDNVVRKGFDLQKRQAEEFAEIFEGELPEDIQEIIEEFKNFPKYGVMKRLYITKKYKLHYLSYPRTIGECFLMPRDT